MIGDLFDSPWKIAIIAILIIVLFGSRKLPGAARSLGQSMRILKKEISGLHEEDEPGAPGAPGAPATAADATPAAAPAQLQATPTAPVAPAATPAAPDAQAQIAALQDQLNNLQQTVGANGTTATDTQQTR
jgi:sec-independent protein translocase protein TatA